MHDIVIFLERDAPPLNLWLNHDADVSRSLPTRMLLRIFLIAVYALILPWVLLYRTLAHYIVSPTHPAWGLFEELVVASGRLYYYIVRKPIPSSYPPAPISLSQFDFDPTSWKIRKFAKWRVGKRTKVYNVRLPKIDEKFVKGVAMAGSEHVKKVDVPGFWVCREDSRWAKEDGVEISANEGEKVIVFAPGGGIHALTSPVPYGLALSTHLRILALNSRPAINPSTAFPAQLIDAMAGYSYLTHQLGFRSENIMLVGESAGAYLHLALMTYLSELKSEGIDAGMVGAAALMSPACNLSRFDAQPVRTDFRFPTYRKLIVPLQTYHFSSDALATSPYFSPSLAGQFAYLSQAPHRTKVWIQYGDSELFADDIKKLIDRMKEQGVDVREDAIYGGLHCDATIRRAFGRKEKSWVMFLEAVKDMGWQASDDAWKVQAS
ncbi:alpha/beta-hydrolase [Neolentinus lepideus HHB14362 ss-1]|uniref:Alpha/beta-hydrolase n=1 Tax=Neolentinus lepideus HHB14362 ss-1 TaxID=1314782 RepID=A0A165QKC8_9AGAM|nr:alpha/beta-hydrolase [Neolentinus lepideus HHB14362 ss-1]